MARITTPIASDTTPPTAAPAQTCFFRCGCPARSRYWISTATSTAASSVSRKSTKNAGMQNQSLKSWTFPMIDERTRKLCGGGAEG